MRFGILNIKEDYLQRYKSDIHFLILIEGSDYYRPAIKIVNIAERVKVMTIKFYSGQGTGKQSGPSF